MSVLTQTDFSASSSLVLLSRGKVRDVYALPEEDGKQNEQYLLFVATDRISAYDVVLQNGIPNKGRLLTKISAFWFDRLQHVVPNHVVAASLDAPSLPDRVKDIVKPHYDQLEGRSMLVYKAQVVKLEAIVRGYLTGSAWSEYKKSQTVHGITLPAGLQESAKLPEPLFTPSTKADAGMHDENISPEKAKELIGAELYDQISSTAIQIFLEASSYALERGLILADSKFEFGLISSSSGEQLILVDELLTPDSSRYWSAAEYEPGRSQRSFDKQFLRDWLVQNGFKKGLEAGLDGNGWTMSEEVVKGTQERYEEVVSWLIGNKD